MKALRFHKARDLRLEDVAPPAPPRADEVIIDVSQCGICGTDIHEYLSGPHILPATPHPVTGARIPIILGHEFSGVVSAIGPEVTGLAPGDRVAILPHLMQRGDYYVRRNLGQFSPTTGLVGLTWHWGGMGEQVMVPQENVVKLPDEVSDDQGAMLEPAAVAVNAIDHARITAGSTVLITGAGPIGALTALAARAAGAARIFVHEPNEGRLKPLRAFDGLTLFSGPPGEVLDAVRSATDQGVGVDAAIECAGHPAALDLCIAATRCTGILAQVGFYARKPEVDMFRICEKGLHLIGCWGNDITLGPRLVAMIASGKFPVETLVTGRVALGRAVADGFEALTAPGNDHIKILIDLSRH